MMVLTKQVESRLTRGYMQNTFVLFFCGLDNKTKNWVVYAKITSQIIEIEKITYEEQILILSIKRNLFFAAILLIFI